MNKVRKDGRFGAFWATSCWLLCLALLAISTFGQFFHVPSHCEGFDDDNNSTGSERSMSKLESNVSTLYENLTSFNAENNSSESSSSIFGNSASFVELLIRM